MNVVSGESPNAEYFYLHDGLGTVHQILDASQNVENQYDYEGFGTSLSSTENIYNRFRYTGREFDEETESTFTLSTSTLRNDGLYYYRARTYDTTIGSFTSSDPIPALNLYPYCGQNPIYYMDSLGTIGYPGPWWQEPFRENYRKKQALKRKYEKRMAKYLSKYQGITFSKSTFRKILSTTGINENSNWTWEDMAFYNALTNTLYLDRSVDGTAQDLLLHEYMHAAMDRCRYFGKCGSSGYWFQESIIMIFSYYIAMMQDLDSLEKDRERLNEELSKLKPDIDTVEEYQEDIRLCPVRFLLRFFQIDVRCGF